ncbi:MAG: hypoxanthine phosphoribosyltransferase [Oscillospiraceae bacterium]|nr:hypoxanthine phosphoribosyltransferase [Oscillospiraceae bacterium]MBR4691416.1 hypoxanthine phosphoribosyltransferase [Oscillospiraceae bacterium]
MERYTLETLISAGQLAEKTAELGRQLTLDYKDKDTVFVGILKGSFIFMADLVRQVKIDRLEICFMMVSSYGSGTRSTGNIIIKKDLENDLAGKHVLIVEDIIDSGNTLTYLKKYLANRQAASVRVCTMLDKPSRRETDLVPDYRGFEIPDAFAVGYGLDYQEHFRELPDLCVLRRDGEQA